jgi:hypothetical protein
MVGLVTPASDDDDGCVGLLAQTACDLMPSCREADVEKQVDLGAEVRKLSLPHQMPSAALKS